MLAHVVCQQIVLLFLIRGIVKRLLGSSHLLRIRTKQEIDERGIVEDAVNIGTHTLVIDDVTILAAIVEDSQRTRLSLTQRTTLAHVDLIAANGATTTELRLHLTGALLTAHDGSRRQQSEAWQALNVTLHMIRVADLHTHQLITTTNAQYRSPLTTSTHDGFRTTVTTEFVEVAQRRFGTRQNDDIRLGDVIGIIGIEQMYTRVSLEGVEVGIVGEMFEHDNRHVHLTLLQLPRLTRQSHTVFLLDMDILEVGNDAQHWYTTERLKHLAPLIKQTQVTTKLIDDDALDQLTVCRFLQGNAPIDGGEDTPTIDVGHEDHICTSMTRHRQIHEVRITEIQF